ncbi:MAG: GYD domain-containing protein [Chloroflexi bacterium]|nr:GYD domain-containing protein [Ktedonobacteraceae bacterium]MBV9019210.1 GYD domain-containing protein [Ktedonobacteraceae bacterium]MBV9709123.1 GYD domain-containing protein [Chloroflexota bacterium]
MPTYISLVNLTEQGAREAKNAPERLRVFDEALREAGGRLVNFYLVMGQFDYIVITEAPDDETAARLILSTIAQGSLRTQTMRAFPRDEFEHIARGLRS